MEKLVIVDGESYKDWITYQMNLRGAKFVQR